MSVTIWRSRRNLSCNVRPEIASVARLFDPTHSGYVDISMFKQILKTKHVSASDVNEMIEGMMLKVCRYV